MERLMEAAITSHDDSLNPSSRRAASGVPMSSSTRRSTHAHDRCEVGPPPRGPPGRRSTIVGIGAGTAARRDPACRHQMTYLEGDGSLHDRVLGMLLGLACAEAIGAPFSGEERVDRWEIERWAYDTRPLHWSSMTRMLHTVLARLSVEPRLGAVDGAGTALPMEFSALEIRGLREHDARRPLRRGESNVVRGGTGNGAAVWGVAVAPTDHDLDRLAAIARASARLTHPHEIGQDGAAAVAIAAAIAFRTPQRPLQLDPTVVLGAISARLTSDAFRHALEAVHTLLTDRWPDPVADVVGAGPIASESVPAALVAVLRHPDSYVATVKEAVGFGGDTARIAAISAAISAARLGTAAIPVAWVDRLDRAGHLRGLAAGLVRATLRSAKARRCV
ncbi:ADP-ribosylglycohydrolase family protein [Pseudonocardia abyssalis]|uniref:ADP-ribosylglycohydrolase family protein n=1 Tax=Pseudonocardia abyssalis TaxID=2792008 RepID=A0ABS6US27_9PSEU|nr:ADP-ribosylglycohydrolase family protein [Pseudonocardia abyssalis]